MSIKYFVCCVGAIILLQGLDSLTINNEEVETVISNIGHKVSQEFSRSNKDPRMFENTINQTIESIRPLIPEPIEIGSFSLVDPIDVNIFSGTLNVTDLKIGGIKDFQVQYLKILPGMGGYDVTITLNLPQLQLDAYYNLDSTLMAALPLSGKGNASITLIDLKLSINTLTPIDMSDLLGKLSVHNFTISINLGAALFHFTELVSNDMDVGQLLGVALDIFVPALLNDNAEAISAALSPVLEEAINSILDAIRPTTTTTVSTTTTTLTPEVNKMESHQNFMRSGSDKLVIDRLKKIVALLV